MVGQLRIYYGSSGFCCGNGKLMAFPHACGGERRRSLVLVYLICIFLVGIPLIIAEISIGRAGGKDAFGSYKALNSKWGGVGILAVITSFIGLSYYAVLGGWVIRYIFVSVTGLPKSSEAFFTSFTSNTGSQIIYYLVFMVITVAIVVMGIQKGIEKSCKIMMPLLILCLIVIVIRSCTLPVPGRESNSF